MARLHTVVVIALFCAAVACCFGGLYLGYRYDTTKPRYPDPASGRTHQHNDHGAIVYLTKDEDDRLFWLQVLGIAFGLAGGALSIRFNVNSDPLRGFSHRRRYEILNGPGIDYEAVRKTYDRAQDGGA